MNRVIRVKARIVLAGRQTLTLRTEEGIFEIIPKLARKLLREAKPRASSGKKLLQRESMLRVSAGEKNRALAQSTLCEAKCHDLGICGDTDRLVTPTLI